MATFENTVLEHFPEAPQRPAKAGHPAVALAKPRRSAVRWTKALVYSVCAAMLALNLWFVYLSWVYTKRQVVSSSANLSESLAQQVNATLLDVEHVLDDVVFEIERTGLGPAAMDRLRPSLVNKTMRVDQLKGLFVYDDKGRSIVSSVVTSRKSIDYSDRDYFIHHRRSNSSATQVSSPVVSKSSGEWVVPMSRRLNDERGRFIGVAIATVRLDYLRRMIEKIDVGKEGAISLTLDKRLMLRKPYVEEFLNMEVHESPMVQMADTLPSGLSEQRSPYDDVTRLMNFTYPKDYRIIVNIAIGKDEAFREWRKIALSLTAVIVALCGATLLGGRYIVVSLRLREEAEAQVHLAQRKLDKANRQLMNLAFNDGLTGVPNRRHFDIYLRRTFRNAQRHGRSLAVVMIDVDEFKRFNDHYGHGAGDACLRMVAQALRAAVRRPEDLPARYGGEEFVLLLPDTDADGALQVAETARASVFDAGIPHAVAAHQRVTVSLGVTALVPARECTPEHLLRMADEALYRAKQQGRNRSMVGSPAATLNEVGQE